MLLFLAVLGLVFFATLAVMNTVAWALLLVMVVLVGGAVLGASTDID